MKSIKVCEYSRSRSFHYDLILQDQASGERSPDQWSSGCMSVLPSIHPPIVVCTMCVRQFHSDSFETLEMFFTMV